MQWKEVADLVRYPDLDLAYTIDVSKPLSKDPKNVGAYVITANVDEKVFNLRLWERTFLALYDLIEKNEFKDTKVVFYRLKDSKTTLVKSVA